MNFRVVKSLICVIVAVVGVWLLADDAFSGALTADSGLPGVLLLGSAAMMYRSSSPFELCRWLIGAVLASVSGWLIVIGVVGLYSSFVSEGGVAGPLASVIGGLIILGAYYFSLWTRSAIRRTLENIFSIPELLQKIAFTLGLLVIYRIGFHVSLPGINNEALEKLMGAQEKGVFGQALQYFAMFTGGTLSRSTLFGLGIMPYISASIIFQLLTTVVPALERLQKEGPTGYKKIQEYTRYATVVLCLVQATFWMRYLMSVRPPLVYPEYQGQWWVFMMGVLGMTGGTIFLMWLGEQIDEYGIGNGISLLIMAGIVSRLPGAIIGLVENTELSIAGVGSSEQIGPLKILFLIGAFVFVVAGAILITQGQRRIPIQQAKQMRGRRVYGGQRHYMPLRVNHGGVMPIIFASSLMIFPGVVFGKLAGMWPRLEILRALADAFRSDSYIYAVVYIGMIFFFAYFWTTIQFRPKDMADQLRDYGHFIPGLRPGKRTAEYLERVMERITYCGAAFLAVIAVIPQVLANWLRIPFGISAFLGGTGLLIMVSVTLDLVQRIESQLVMRNYGGFLSGGTRIKGAYR